MQRLFGGASTTPNDAPPNLSRLSSIWATRSTGWSASINANKPNRSGAWLYTIDCPYCQGGDAAMSEPSR